MGKSNAARSRKFDVCFTSSTVWLSEWNVLVRQTVNPSHFSFALKSRRLHERRVLTLTFVWPFSRTTTLVLAVELFRFTQATCQSWKSTNVDSQISGRSLLSKRSSSFMLKIQSRKTLNIDNLTWQMDCVTNPRPSGKENVWEGEGPLKIQAKKHHAASTLLRPPMFTS